MIKSPFGTKSLKFLSTIPRPGSSTWIVIKLDSPRWIPLASRDPHPKDLIQIKLDSPSWNPLATRKPHPEDRINIKLDSSSLNPLAGRKPHPEENQWACPCKILINTLSENMPIPNRRIL